MHLLQIFVYILYRINKNNSVGAAQYRLLGSEMDKKHHESSRSKCQSVYHKVNT